MSTFTKQKPSATIYVPARVIAWEAPTIEALTQAGSTVFPEVKRWHALSIDLSAPIALPELPGPEARLVLWITGIAGSASAARSLLHNAVRPLLDQRHEFLVGFEHERTQVVPACIDLAERWRLDVEDAVSLLEADAVPEHFPLLHLLRTRVALTPIEEQLAAALERENVKAEPQIRFGRFTVDFLVRENGSTFAVEADGATFHEAGRDSRRDAALRDLGITDVIRFTGSEIYRDADRCAARVKERLQGLSQPSSPVIRQSLDPSQSAAVRHSGDATRVLAPAGAGKTRVLVNRIAELIERGVEPSSILALAFNKKAEEQMTETLKNTLRIGVAQQQVYDRSDPGVRVLTFNAFGRRTLDELFGFRPSPVSDRAVLRDAMAVATQRAGTHLGGSPRGSDPVGELIRARDRVVADLQPVKTQYVEFEQIKAPPVVAPFEPVNEEYEAELVRRGICSFDDQIGDAVRRLLGDREQRLFVQNSFTHVLVDEFQDLNASQLALLDIVSRPHAQLFVVGDDDQMIYGWRYADLSNILDFEKRQPGADTYVLNTNYRCSVAVVRASLRVIDNNTNRVPKAIEPTHDASEGTVAYSVSPVLEERLKDVVEFAKASRVQSGEWREIAVLCRYKSQQPLVALALDQADIPRTPLLRYRLFTDPAAILLRSYLSLLLAPDRIDGDSLAYLLNRPNRYMTRELEDRLRSSGQPWHELIAELQSGLLDLQNAFRWRAIDDLVQRILSLRDELTASKPAPAEVLARIVDAFALERYWVDASKSGRPADENDPLSLVRLLQLHASDHDSAVKFAAYWDEQHEIEAQLIGMESDRLGREVDDSQDRLVIGTIHASKGREYDAVALFDFDVTLEGLEHHQLEEERRVFYVGMTRAKDRLLLTADSNRRTHPFILESIRDTDGRAELQKLQSAKRVFVNQRAETVIQRSKAQDALERYESGAEGRRLNEELAPHTNRIGTLTRELGSLQTWLANSSLLDAILGRRRKTRATMAVLEQERRAVDATSERIRGTIRLLEADPLHFTGPLINAIESAKTREVSISLEICKVDDRESELDLLENGPKTPAPGTANLRVSTGAASVDPCG